MNVLEIGETAFLSGAAAIVTVNNNSGFMDDTKDQYVEVTPKSGCVKKAVKFIPNGEGNRRPNDVLRKVYYNITTASNIDFNSNIIKGDGLMPVKKVRENNQLKFQPLLDSEAPEVFEFLQNNNVARIIQEAASDLACFADGFVELICNNDRKNPKVVMARYKEYTFSRLSKMDEEGRIEYHGYSAKWTDSNGQADDVIVTDFLDRDAPIYDLKYKLGLLPDHKTGLMREPVKSRNFVMSLSLPTPGRFYYPKPWWWSIFASRWYDFACSIPLFKTALIENEMVLKYHVKINSTFWEKLYAMDGITDPEKKKARKSLFLDQLDKFLSGKQNAGKSFVSHFKYDQAKGFVENDIIIEPIQSFLKGGEYIEDYEEASNAICYAMGVHPSLQGANPGKGKTINGTEARELFIIKQAISKPIREMILQFIYAVKEINKWDPDIHFVIPNITLTTLDQGTGAVKNIGSQPV